MTPNYIHNRAPLRPTAFLDLPLGAIEPGGWLRDQLEIQAEGLSGHFDEFWPDGGGKRGWLGRRGQEGRERKRVGGGAILPGWPVATGLSSQGRTPDRQNAALDRVDAYQP